MPRNAGASRARRPHGVETIPGRRGADTEAPPAMDAGVAETDGDVSQADLDTASTGMAMLLRVALRLMKS